MKLIQDVIAFCEITGQKPKQIPSRKLDRIFGKSALGKQLRKDILTVVNHYYNPEAHICKEYVINWGVYQELLTEYTAALNLKKPHIKLSVEAVSFDCVSQEVEREYGEELASGQFNYIRKGYRYYHSLQNLPKEQRSKVFKEYGYKWDYDIEAAMPTLIKQYAVRAGLTTLTPYYDEMLANRKRVREQIAHDLGITIPQAKILLTSLINGAKVAISNSHTKYALHELFEDDGVEYSGLARIIAINGSEELNILPHEWLAGYREDIRAIWSAIKQAGAITRRFKDISYERVNPETGEIYDINYVKELPLTSKQKAFLYQKLEHEVMYEVRNYLELNYIKYYQIHDGMMTDKKIDVNELQEYIFDRTEYRVKFEEQVLGITSDYNHRGSMHMCTQVRTTMPYTATKPARRSKSLLKKLLDDYKPPIVADDAPF